MEQVSPGVIKTHLKPKGLRWVLIAADFVFWKLGKNWIFDIFLKMGCSRGWGPRGRRTVSASQFFRVCEREGVRFSCGAR